MTIEIIELQPSLVVQGTSTQHVEAVQGPNETAATLLAKLLTVDGAGSLLDADFLDGQDSGYYTNIVARLGYTPLNATAYTAADVLAKLLTVDGTGSGLDADTLNGFDSAAFARLAAAAAFTSTLSVAAAFAANGGATLGDAAADALTINSSAASIPNGINLTGGNVGIGLTPTNKLDVGGIVRAVSSTFGQSDVMAQTTAATGTGYARFILKTADREWRLINDASSAGSPFLVYDATAATERMRIDASGNVTPGVTATQSFGSGTLAWSILYAGQVQAPAAGDLTLNASNAAGQIALRTAGGERMRIDASGNVGIGGASGGNILELIKGAGVGAELTIRGNGNAGATGLSIQQAGDSVAYIYQRSNQPLIFGTNNAERMRIDASGNVGIGITPAYKLDVNGAVRLNSIERSTAGQLYINASDAAGFVTVNTAGGERMRIDSSGNVQVGGATSRNVGGYKFLSVLGTSGGYTDFYSGATLIGAVGAEPASFNVNANGAIPLVFNTNGAERMRIGAAGGVTLTQPAGTVFTVTDSTNSKTGYINFNNDSWQFYRSGPVEVFRTDASGNIGIGGASNGSKLHVLGNSGTLLRVGTDSGNGQTNYFPVVFGDGNGGGGGTNQTFVRIGRLTDGTAAIDAFKGGVGADALAFSRYGTESMRIDSSGRVLIGKASSPGNFKLDIDHDGGVVNGLAISDTNSSAGAPTSIAITARANDTSDCINLTSASAQRFKVLRNGNVQNANNSYGAISDIKLKQDIEDATPKLESLRRVRIVNYALKTDPEHRLLGVIAQELESVFPGLVETTVDRDRDGNDLGTTTKAVKYSVFIPILVKAVQELASRLIALEQDQ